MSQIKQYDLDGVYHLGDAYMSEVSGGEYVEYTDHLASHAFDEEKERVLFEADMVTEGYDVRKEPDLAGVYVGPVVHTMWQGWKRCAKSRARAAGCL